MEQLVLAGTSMSLRRVGVGAGTTNTLTTALDNHYYVDGKTFSVAAATNYAAPTTDVNTGAAFAPVPANSACVFVLANATGGVSFAASTRVAQGSIVTLDGTADGANASYVSSLPGFPAVPDNHAIYGWCLVKVGASGSPWTFGTSNNSGVSNVSITFTSAAVLPDRPTQS